MKNFMILIFLLLAVASFAQKKGKDKAPAQPDTVAQKLTAENKALTEKNDSLSKELEKYFGLYAVIRDKVVKMDFDPTKMSKIIDSLQAGRQELSLSAASSVMLRDSIKKIIVGYDSIRKENTGLLYAVNLLKGGPATNPTDPKDFTGTWTLILRKIKVTGESSRSGLVDISSEPLPKTATFLEGNLIATVNFIDKEFAEFTFNNGEKGKCYYVINEFSKTKPYYIDFKGTKADIRMYFMNTVSGPRISFQIPGVEGQYYFGQITK